MSITQAKGTKGRADFLFSRLVRESAGHVCRRCGARGTDTAHIIPRRYSATRCVEDNAWCLCRSCHKETGDFPHLHMWLVESTIGMPRYHELYQLAQHGPATSARLWWIGEVERLEERCAELGIDTRRRVSV